MTSKIPGFLRYSTKSDIDEIHRWLQEQDRQNFEGSFLCNWELTQQSHEEGSLLVYVEEKTESAIAYQWGGLLRPGILEVRIDKRWQGVGKALVDRCIQLAADTDHCVLRIQCKPSTSIPFWERMGFYIYDERNSYAFMFLPKINELPNTAEPVDVTISFYPESMKWESDTLPCETFQPAAVLSEDNSIHLSKRVCFFPLSMKLMVTRLLNFLSKEKGCIWTK